ncbi:MAG TPA: molybdenum cofactor biosynthesis protein MoaE [Candidatus Binataceae bacterium]
MNRLQLKLFATLRERAHASELTREFPDGTTVGEIWQKLVAEFPALAGHHDSVGFAVNQEYVEAEFVPRDNDELAFIPPVSGGTAARASDADLPAARASDAGLNDAPWIGQIAIGHKPIDVAALEREVSHPAAGAIVTFAGTTRRENVGRKVLKLEYEAYEPMALSEMRTLARQAGERWKIIRIAIQHRIGVVEIGEISVAISVSAAHRGEAFQACRFAIDRLKEIVPIWKKEHFEGGQVWVGCQTSHPPEIE